MEETVRTFYSKCGNLICYLEKPKRVIENGQATVLEGPRIEFSPQADGYGRFVTSDSLNIAFLEKRARETGDIFDGATYDRLTTPPEVRNAQLERQITANNSLIEQLKSQLGERASSAAKR